MRHSKSICMKKLDPVEELIEKIVNNANEPLETTEIIEDVRKRIGKVSRSKVLYRLNNLRAESEIAGKPVGSGKGTWIWFSANKKTK
jgi:repressor of nif and glnA expression